LATDDVVAKVAFVEGMSNYLPFTLTDNNFATLPIAFFPKEAAC
jgi:hypothetical protein